MVASIMTSRLVLFYVAINSVHGFLATQPLQLKSYIRSFNSRAAISVKCTADDEVIADSVIPSDGPSRRRFVQIVGAAIFGAYAFPAFADLPQGRSVPFGTREKARGPEGVNRPDLLPDGPKVNIIDLEKMLAPSQSKKIDKLLANLERDTGYKFRVLCQRYPQTPGLAIKNYWDLDDKSIVMVVDRGASKSGMANILNFNVGQGVDLALPPVFWTRLRNFFGTVYYVKDNGEDSAIINAVDTVVACLRKGFCTDVPKDLKDIANGNF